jgi:hypothetical protein
MNPRYGMPMLLTKNDRRYQSSEVRGQIHEMVKLPGNEMPRPAMAATVTKI